MSFGGFFLLLPIALVIVSGLGLRAQAARIFFLRSFHHFLLVSFLVMLNFVTSSVMVFKSAMGSLASAAVVAAVADSFCLALRRAIILLFSSFVSCSLLICFCESRVIVLNHLSRLTLVRTFDSMNFSYALSVYCGT
jgi:hypothetical protein